MLNYFGKIFAGGFFRTLGKIFAFLIVGIFIAWLTGFINIGIVKAASYAPSVEINGNPVNNYPYYLGLSNKNNGINFSLGISVRNEYSYNFGYISFCSGGGLDVGKRNPTACTDGNCFGQSFVVESTRSYCKQSNGNDGEVYNVYFRVQKWNMGTMLSIVSNNLYVKNKYWSEYVSVIGVYLTSEDMGLGISQGNQINDNLNDIHKNQEIINNSINAMKDSLNIGLNAVKDASNEINNTLKDDSVDTNQANGFFDSFDNKDHGGISGVITAPLSAINKINQPCSVININLWDKDIELPCGDTLFWNKENVSSFKGVWNILVGGPIIYLLMVKLFKVIQSLKNPDDSRVEVAKL